SAEAPFVAETTSYACAVSTASSRRTFSGTSSTTRIRALCSLTARVSAVLLHRLDELHDVHGLRDIGVEAGVEEPFTIAVHGLRGERHGRDPRLHRGHAPTMYGDFGLKKTQMNANNVDRSHVILCRKEIKQM